MPYQYIKTDQEYVQQIADDAQTIEYETTKENKDFINTAIEFNKVDLQLLTKKTRFLFWFISCSCWFATWKSKYQWRTKREDIFIDDDLFSDSEIKDEDKQYTNDILKHINHCDMLITQPTVKPIKPEPAPSLRTMFCYWNLKLLCLQWAKK